MPFLIPMLGAVLQLIRNHKNEIAEKSGVAADGVQRVSDVVEAFLSKEERTQAALLQSVEQARQHDAALPAGTLWMANLRACVRPVVSLTAMVWYVYARANGIALQSEDYAIIGGILAFWFGFRPFEKSR